MRKTLNKAITGTGLLPVKDHKRTSADATGVFQRVKDAAAAVSTEAPAIRAEYAQRLREAQAAQRAAQMAKETAESEQDLDQAIDDESRARDKVAFYKRKIASIDFTPRMDEDEYFSLVDEVDAVVSSAALDFRKVAERAITEIIEARDKYEEIMTEADSALETLDFASNVLQVKYRYRKYEYVGRDPVYREDPYEWLEHTVRYCFSRGAGHSRGVCLAINDMFEKPADCNQANPTLSVAWHAVDDVKFKTRSQNERMRIAANEKEMAQMG